MAFTNLDVSDSGTGQKRNYANFDNYTFDNYTYVDASGERRTLDDLQSTLFGAEKKVNSVLGGEQQQSTASGSNGNTSFKLEALISFINSAKLAIDDIKNDISQISLYAESMSNILIGDDSGLCETWKALKETADGLLEAFNSRAENFIIVIENYYKESVQNSGEWNQKVSKVSQGLGEIQSFLRSRSVTS